MRVSTKKMNYDEWIEFRNLGIGGSDVATVLGLNKYKSPYQLWLEKTGQIELSHEESEPAYFGTKLEDFVAKEFEIRSGKKVRKSNYTYIHEDYDFLRANVDRLIVNENAILECKTASTFLKKEWENDEVPLAYLCQVQHYMNVLNKQYAYFAVLIGGQKFVWKKINRDQELIDMIQEKLVSFWNDNIIGGNEPTIDGTKATTDFINKMYGDVGEEQITLSKDYDSMLDNKKELKEQIKVLQENVKEIDNQIKITFKNKNACLGLSPRYIIKIKEIKTKSLNKKMIAEKYPDVISDETIYKESTSYRLTEKEL